MGAALKIYLAGVQRTLDKARKLGERYEKSLAAGIYGLGEEIMTDAKQRVPVDFGALKGSGYVTRPVEQSRALVVELGFGGPAKDYAVVQHERTEFRHEVGEAKYLENAINAASGGAMRRVADIAEQAYAAGVGASGGTHAANPNAGQRGGGKDGSG